MTIHLDPALEIYLREHADAAGVSVDAYIERLIRANQVAEQELETLALEGLQSGTPIEGSDEFWAERERQLADRLRTPRSA